MNINQCYLGCEVVSLCDFSGVPKGTHGVIDELCSTGAMVAWDLPEHPLPKGYKYWNGKPSCAPGQPLRDGFSFQELQFLTPCLTEVPPCALPA
jgi:hypothetical protein